MYHTVEIIGNLGRDPEMSYNNEGQAMTRFSVASSERWKSKDGAPQERTTWWNVTVFGKQAEACNQYLSRGKRVFVTGRMTTDPETGGPRIYKRKDDTYGASFEVVAGKVVFLTPKGESGDSTSHGSSEDSFGSGVELEEVAF